MGTIHHHETSNVYCIGHNHISLTGSIQSKVLNKVEDHLPLLASKSTTALTGANSPIKINKQNHQVDWEAELVLKIGKSAFNLVDTIAAREIIQSWGVGNDISDRWWQGNGGGQWIKGKSFPGFAPHNIDYKSVSPDFNLDRQIKCWVNDELMQDSSLNEYIFPPDWLVWHLSQSIMLKPGDLIFCGTFPGCGFHQKPERFLKPGDLLRTLIEGLGELNNQII